MYTPPMFKSDRAASLAFAEARGFGLACAWDGAKPIASPLPFYLTFADDGTPQAAFHVARHNPLVKLADGTTSVAAGRQRRRCLCVTRLVRLAGSGADLALSGGASDRARCGRLSDDELAEQIETLSAKFEDRLLPKKPWMSSKMTAGRLEATEEGDRGSGDDG